VSLSQETHPRGFLCCARPTRSPAQRRRNPANHLTGFLCRRWRIRDLWREPRQTVWRGWRKVVADSGALCLIYGDLRESGWFPSLASRLIVSQSGRQPAISSYPGQGNLPASGFCICRFSTFVLPSVNFNVNQLVAVSRQVVATPSHRLFKRNAGGRCFIHRLHGLTQSQ
jgi:hypothetical protein